MKAIIALCAFLLADVCHSQSNSVFSRGNGNQGFGVNWLNNQGSYNRFSGSHINNWGDNNDLYGSNINNEGHGNSFSWLQWSSLIFSFNFYFFLIDCPLGGLSIHGRGHKRIKRSTLPNIQIMDVRPQTSMKNF